MIIDSVKSIYGMSVSDEIGTAGFKTVSEEVRIALVKEVQRLYHSTIDLSEEYICVRKDMWNGNRTIYESKETFSNFTLWFEHLKQLKKGGSPMEIQAFVKPEPYRTASFLSVRGLRSVLADSPF